MLQQGSRKNQELLMKFETPAKLVQTVGPNVINQCSFEDLTFSCGNRQLKILFIQLIFYFQVPLIHGPH